jgi:glycosyltransferase involved in cell wall biosynthesis
MPVYNCELYIREAVDSILNQTFTDFEFLIIDDASTDETVTIIKTYNDSRIQLIQKPANSGYTNSLNHGLKIAKGKYIARMDGDDISLPERFEKQVNFLDANPNILLCGSWFNVIGTDVIIRLPENFEAIKLALLRKSCIAHPSVMMRNNKLHQFNIFYDVKTEPAEDYDLWVRLSAIGELYNLPEVLLDYRVHNSQVTQKRKKQQIQSALGSSLKMLNYLNCSFDDEETDLLKKIVTGSLSITLNEIKGFDVLIEKMILANSNNFFDPNGFQEYLFELHRKSFKNYFLEREKYYPIICFQYFTIDAKYGFKLKWIDELKLIIKSIICFKKKRVVL